MYVPKHFDSSDTAWCHDLMRREGFALLVTVDEAGVPFASHLPILLDAERGPFGTLEAHVARANGQWRHFADGRPALCIFRGPHAYVSPAWYGEHPSVPTWNYVAVHASGVPAVIDDAARVRALLGRLVATYEGGRAAPWRLEPLADEYVERMMRGIVAFEIPIDRLAGKAKLGQNRSDGDRASVIDGLRAETDPLAHAVAGLMAERPPR